MEYVEEEGVPDMCLAMENRMRQVYAEGLVEGAVWMGVRAGMTAKEIVGAVVVDHGADREHVEEPMRAQGAWRAGSSSRPRPTGNPDSPSPKGMTVGELD